MRRLANLGIGLVLVGGFLAVAFWPVASVSGAELLSARSGNTYSGYAVGARILVRERVLQVSFAQFFGFSFVHLEDGNLDEDTIIWVRGDARPFVAPGMTVYGSAVLQQAGSAQYWEVATPQDLRDSMLIDVAFYGILGLGVALVAFEVIRKRGPAPEG